MPDLGGREQKHGRQHRASIAGGTGRQWLLAAALLVAAQLVTLGAVRRNAGA